MSKRPNPSSQKPLDANKRPRGSIAIGIGKSRGKPVSIKADPDAPRSTNRVDASKALREEFIALFSTPTAEANGISNTRLKAKFPGDKYKHLVPIINALNRESRLSMSRVGDELIYNIVDENLASKFAGLDSKARMVYQVIQKSGNKGIWTKEIKQQTEIQQQALTKIYKILESRKLIKPLKAVTAKSKKLYMLYDITPAKEITGGPWYTELEFDHEFIAELRTFIMHCVQRLNGGKGITLTDIVGKMKQANVSRVELSKSDVQQLMQTLAYDYKIEHAGENLNGEALYVAGKKVTSYCDFKWWNVLCPDFQYRDIVFEDGVVLRAHENHHQTS